MYMVAAYLVSVLTGQAYAEFVRERIFEPLGIPRGGATFSPSDADKTGNMSSAWYARDRATLHQIPFFSIKSPDLDHGAGGVIMSVKGLVRTLILICALLLTSSQLRIEQVAAGASTQRC